MKKIALALCAVLSAVFMATGCVSREKESSSDPSVIGPSNVEIYLPDGAPLWRWPNSSIGTGKGTRNTITL